MKPEIKLRPMKCDFILFCVCGEVTTYGSSYKIMWKEGMYLECRKCKRKYYPIIKVEIG